jgi:release factor glutamine methyltransferase
VTTARELLADARDRLARAGVPTPAVDAELLLAHQLGTDRPRLALVGEVGASDAFAFVAMVGRRATREPLQYITGQAPFRHIELAVGPGVFVPRPETELLVDAVLPYLRARPSPAAVDLCAGSGALALALLDEVPGLEVLAVEQDGPALAWLRRNCDQTRAVVLVADVTDARWSVGRHGSADVVVSNPPYVSAATPVSAEARADPPSAVFAGVDGLAVMPAVLARSAELLRPGGIVAIEHDQSHAMAVPALMAADPRWTDIADHLDLTGRPRYATAVRGPT